MKCKWRWCQNQLSGKQTSYCSPKCKNKGCVDKRRKKLKILAVGYKGGKCLHCGYSKCVAALEFHHKNKNNKNFGIAGCGTTKSWSRIKEELNKCDLLCANCHREVEYKEKYEERKTN